MVSPEDEPGVDEEELYSSWALLIQTTLLIGALWTSYYLQLKKIRAVHETVVSIFAGMFVGLIIRVSPGWIIQKMVTFNHAYFFNLLLPPIILSSGYELRRDDFFRNFGTILVFAMFGTFISALVTGFLVGFLGLIGLVSLSFLDSMIFGAVLSATDPVTILAVFQTFKVDPTLYSIIFGESILNDAVAIVLYETLKQFRNQDLHLSNIIRGIGTFLGIFTASLWIGVGIALLCALMLKYSQLHKYPAIESCIIGLIAYNSYFFSNGIKMSGIVSLLFCGITLKHYAYDNMSLRTKRTTKYMFRVMAQLSENFIYIYLGLALFTSTDLQYKPFFILFAFIIICVSRYCAVFPLADLVNRVARYRKRAEHLPHAYKVMLFWAGLRGAVAFALAAELTGQHAPSMRTTILVVVVLSVIVFGGTTSRMLEILKIRIGVEGEDSSDSDLDDPPAGKYDDFEDEGSRHHRNHDFQPRSPQESISSSADSTLSENNRLLPPAPTTASSIAARNRASDQTHWFMSFDDRFLKPLFSRHKSGRLSPAKERWRHENLVRRGTDRATVEDDGAVVRLVGVPQSDNGKNLLHNSKATNSNLSSDDLSSGDDNEDRRNISKSSKGGELPPINLGDSLKLGISDSNSRYSSENLSLHSITPATNSSHVEVTVGSPGDGNTRIPHVIGDSEDDDEPLLDLSHS